MCLLVLEFTPDAEVAVLLGANRDERLDRPAAPFGVLADAPRRVLGGRDLAAGGTWLAINREGVVAGLTNRPSPGGADPSRASRGALPLLAAAHPSAVAAAEALAAGVRPGTYNPAWLLVADREALLYLEVGDGPTVARALPPGRHVLENRPIDDPSAKVDRAHALLDDATTDRLAGMRRVLTDHLAGAHPTDGAGDPRRAAAAACVHAPEYGTRSSTIVRIASARGAPPEAWVVEGHPCEGRFEERSDLFGDAASAAAGT